MTRNEGQVEVYGSIAYAPQNPWIMSTSVRDNITFYRHFDEEFYNVVLDGESTLRRDSITDGSLTVLCPPLACALRPDLTLLPQGDMTEVGEKGTLNHMLFKELMSSYYHYLQESRYVRLAAALAQILRTTLQLSGGQRARISLARCV